MSKNRTIYQSEALFAGPSPATGEHFSSGSSGVNLVNQLHRVQTANYNFNIARQDINQFGELGAIGREIIDAPTVALDFSYYVTNALNESLFGFTVDGSCTVISGILAKVADERNYFILTVPEGQDAAGFAGAATGNQVIGLGNAFISSYSTEGAVGGIPTATVRVEALNMKIDAGSTGNFIPAVNPVNGQAITAWTFDLPQAVSGVVGQVTALRPGDITVNITGIGMGDIAGVGVSISDAKIQSYTLSFDLAREPLQKLGSRFAFSKEIRFPVTATCAIEANLGDLSTGNLADILCDDKEYQIDVTLRKPNCTGVGETAVIYTLKAAKLDSQNFTSNIGANKRVTLNFSTQLVGPQDTSRGFMISGILD